ncbi:hypothetical protein ACJIZ3_023708 [Penstemon smallii]|uniref:RecQ-mediated genome instability protein 1 n=1 Tax=Penstemon smallii TaxID=265156 RepID=A0ABD3TPT2_9LAMI
MARRRLRVVCSSDEEDEEPPPPPPPPPPPLQQQHQQDDEIADDIEIDLQTVTLNSSNPTPNTDNSTSNANRTRPYEPIPLEISDEDEEDVNVIDNSSSNRNDNQRYFGVSESPVNGVLEMLGMRLRKEWLDSCLSGLQASVQGFQGMDDSAKAKLCFQQFLFSDMNFCGAGVLPPNVHKLHLVDLKGPFVLQVDEIVNISGPLRGRYQNAAPGIKRCLKLSMTDGVQRVFGMEYRPINDLEALAPAGLKIAICNVNIRHGMLMLVPEVLAVLGGSVEELDAARQRLINEINKPPRGKRNRTGEVPPLATRATLAAWTPNNVSVPGSTERTTSANSAPSESSGQGMPGSAPIPVNNRRRQPFVVPVSGNNAQSNTSSMPIPHERFEVPRPVDRPASIPLQAAGLGTAFGTPVNAIPRQDFAVPVGRNNAESNTLSATPPQHIGDPPTEVMTRAQETDQTTSPGIPANHVPVKDVSVAAGGNSAEPNLSFSVDMDVEEITMVDELEHDFIFSRDKETPFTYLASLSAKLAAIEDQSYIVRGKIKCFLTGVKGFQYKQRATYELRVYVDDGSLISEILIDHTVVQSGIGYSPHEVTSALAASDPKRVSEMKETLKQFQIFLINFEGTILIEMNKSSPVPVASEMNQGCPSSNALLLLKRLQSYSYAQRQNHSHLNPICLSP